MFWYALRSKPNKEMAVCREVRARGMECFYPYLRVKPVNPRSRTIRPYFPGYLFVYGDMEQIGFSTFQWMPFSMGLVSFGAQPAAIPESLIHAIRQRVDQVNAAGGEQLAGLKRGEEVVISGGPFSGYEAIFDQSIQGSERVRVLLKLLAKKELPLELPAGFIQQKKSPLRPGR